MRVKRHFLFASAILPVMTIASTSVADSQDRSAQAAEEIREIHAGLIASHLDHDAEAILSVEAEDYIVVSRGQITSPARGDRRTQFESYLGNVEFEEYRDLVTPIVHVSADGTAGWLITQAKIVSTQRDQDGHPVRAESVWAWVELYEKRDGRWLRVGEVSNRMPASQ